MTLYTEEYGFNYVKRIQRASAEHLWQETDNEEEYQTVGPKGNNLYKPGDFTYKYNAHGFRCDEFVEGADCPVLFIGCSCTEGTGLPLHELWAHKLLEKIRAQTKTPIPFWSLALCGASIDTVAGNLYWFLNKFKVRPKYLVGLLPGNARREFAYKTDQVDFWLPFCDRGQVVNDICVDEYFADHQSIRSLMLIETLAKNINANVVVSFWSIDSNTKTRDWYMTESMFRDFTYVEYPNPEIHNINLARDLRHAGPHMNSVIANKFWDEYFQHKFNS